MARERMNPGTKRHKMKGVKKKARNGAKPLDYKMKKIGPKVKNIYGNTIGHEAPSQAYLSAGVKTALVLTPEAQKRLNLLTKGEQKAKKKSKANLGPKAKIQKVS